MPVRDAPREGVVDGWPDRPTADGPTAWDGVRGVLLADLSVNPEGVITGFGFAPASTKDQPLAETLTSACALKPTQGWGAWGRRLFWDPTRSR